MEILITYDVATESPGGNRRLRRVAKVCQSYGQRVQDSVFECSVNPVQLERLKGRLRKEMKPDEDSLRIYKLREPREEHLEVFGRQIAIDLRGPLVL